MVNYEFEKMQKERNQAFRRIAERHKEMKNLFAELETLQTEIHETIDELEKSNSSIDDTLNEVSEKLPTDEELDRISKELDELLAGL